MVNSRKSLLQHNNIIIASSFPSFLCTSSHPADKKFCIQDGGPRCLYRTILEENGKGALLKQSVRIPCLTNPPYATVISSYPVSCANLRQQEPSSVADDLSKEFTEKTCRLFIALFINKNNAERKKLRPGVFSEKLLNPCW